MTRRHWIHGAAAGMIAICSACTVHVLPVQEVPAPAPYVVPEPPPPPVEVIPARPGSDFVWIRGHWIWHDDVKDYSWSHGFWQHVDRGDHGRDYADARQGDQGRGYADAHQGDQGQGYTDQHQQDNGRGYDNGHQADHGQGNGRGADGAHGAENVRDYGHPPRDRADTIPPRPGQDYEWVKGSWVWHADARQYDWQPGRWERPMHGGRGEQPAGNNGGNGAERHAEQNGRGAHTPEQAPPRAPEASQPTRTAQRHDNSPSQVAVHPEPPMIDRVPARTESADPTPLKLHPSAAPHGTAVYATRQPPPDRAEKIPPRPRGDVVWVGGHWTWQRGTFVWSAGRWATPERGMHQWVKGHWQHEAHGWSYVEGHWR